MKIILNEKAILEKSLNNGYIDKKPTKTIKLLAKYYFRMGQNKKQVIDSIDNFMSIYYEKYNSTDWQDIIERITKDIKKKGNFELLNINKIIIFQEELEIIKNINNLRLEKLAFVLLIYSKIYNQMNKNQTNWINSSLKDIFSDTKMAISTNDKGLMINKLGNMGLLEVSKIVDCTNIKVSFTKNEGNITIEITDFRDFILEYLRWIGDNIGICEGIDCDRLIHLYNTRKYCKDCAREINIKKTIENRKQKMFENEKA